MNFIVILEPSRQQSDYGLSIRQDRQPSIIAFEGFDECLRDAVGFRRADWRETKLKAQGRCGIERVLGDVSRAVVGQPFYGMRRLADPEFGFLTPARANDQSQRLRARASNRMDSFTQLFFTNAKSLTVAIATARARPPICSKHTDFRYLLGTIKPFPIVAVRAKTKLGRSARRFLIEAWCFQCDRCHSFACNLKLSVFLG